MMDGNSSQPAGSSQDYASSGTSVQVPQGPALALPFQPGQVPFSVGAPAGTPPQYPGQQTMPTVPQIPSAYPGYRGYEFNGYPPPFQYPSSIMPSQFPPYPPPVSSSGAMPTPAIASTTAPFQAPVSPTSIPVPGNPGLFYIPQTYGQPQAFTRPSLAPPPASEKLEPSTSQPGALVVGQDLPTTTSIPISEEPIWCFQCQQWHRSKSEQEQVHAPFLASAPVTPQPSTRVTSTAPTQGNTKALSLVAAQPSTQASMTEEDFAARMSQVIKEAVAAELASRNLPLRGAYQDVVSDPRLPQYSSRAPASAYGGQGREWENNYGERPREYGQRSRDYGPRDYGGRSRGHEDYCGYDLDYREADSRQGRYRTPYDEDSRSATPSDARAWRDANTDLDPDEIRAETESMDSSAFSDMEIQDYKRDHKGNHKNNKAKRYGEEESSSEANASDEDTGIPLRYLPSAYPTMSTPKKGYHAPPTNKKDRRKPERSELDRPQARMTKAEEAQRLQQMNTPRRHRRESFQDDYLPETPTQRPRDEKPSRRTHKEEPKAEKVLEEPQSASSKPHNSPSKTGSSKTAPPSTAEAQAAVLAYAQWYAQTYGVDPSFISVLESSMASTSSTVSSKRPDAPKVPSDDDTSVSGGDNASEASWKSADTVKRGNSKPKSRQASDQVGSLRGGRTGFSSPASDLEPLARYLKEAQLKGPSKLQSVESESLTTASDKKMKARKNRLPTPPVSVLAPSKPEVEPSPLVLERNRRQYSLVLDSDSQSLKSATPEEFTQSRKERRAERVRSNREEESTSTKNGKSVESVHLQKEEESTASRTGGRVETARSNTGSKSPQVTERICSIPEYAKPEESSVHTKGVEGMSHSSSERSYLIGESARPNDSILAAQKVNPTHLAAQKKSQGSISSASTDAHKSLLVPIAETVVDEYDINERKGWKWDNSLGGYVNEYPTITESSAERVSKELKDLENDYPQSESELSTTQATGDTECVCGVGNEDAESSVFDFQVENFSDDDEERAANGGEQTPRSEEYDDEERAASEGQQTPRSEEYDDEERAISEAEQQPQEDEECDDTWEDEEEPQLEEGTVYASDTSSEDSYTDEALLEFLSDGRYSDVISGMFSDVDTEVTTFPGADGDRPVGAPRDIRTLATYQTGSSVGLLGQQQGMRAVSGGRARREGGQRVEGGGGYCRGCAEGGCRRG